MSKKGRKGKNGKVVQDSLPIDWEGTGTPGKDLDLVSHGFSTYDSTKGFGGFERCHSKHPTLKLGGGELVGASCNAPRKGFDIYVGLDWGMHRESMNYPWEPKASEVVEIYFPIRDGGIPKDVGQFKKMVVWLAEQLGTGKRVHIGCIGGHGRTGTLIAALVSHIHGDTKAGEWVREHYCKQAIETAEQVKFLEDTFGIEPVAPSKKSFGKSSGGGYSKEELKVTRYTPLKVGTIWDTDWVELPKAS